MSNPIDNFISFFNPERGLRRELARQAIDNIRNYDGASKGRRASSMRASAGDANADLVPSLPMLRRRARDMVRNNPYAFQAIEGIVTNTIGANGITLNATSENKDVLKKYKKLWKKYSAKTEIDYNGKLNWGGIQALVMRCVAESGECIILKRRVDSKSYKTVPIKLQVIEPDYFDHTKDTVKNGNQNYIVDGIEYNFKNQRVAYHIFKEHPGGTLGYFTDSERIPVDQALHIFRILRPGQQRGVPFGVSSYIRLNDLDNYENAQLTKQITAACYAAFIQDGSPEALNPSDHIKGKKMTTRLEPGIIQTLPPGKTITFSNPPSPEGYDIYTRKILQAIAAGYGVTYEVLTGDLSNVNFSTGRMGWIEQHRRISDWQENTIIPQLCDDVINWFNSELELVTGMDLSGIDCSWTVPRREMINVLDETKAIILQIRAGILSWGEAARELGYAPDELADDIKLWFDTLKNLGIIVESDPRNAIANTKGTKNGKV